MAKKKKKKLFLSVSCDPAITTRNEQELRGLIIEAAYDFYATGGGNLLGPCTVTTNTGGTALNLNYEWNSTATTITSTDLMAASWVRLTARDWRRQEVVLANWLPGCDAPAVDQHFGGNLVAPLAPAKIEIINKRAQALLLQHLNERQRATWLASKHFDVVTPRGRRYRLTACYAHNAFLLNAAGVAVREYCVMPEDPGGRLPLEDHLFAQMLTLMYDENEFLRHANTWDLLSDMRVFVGQGRDADGAGLELAA